MAHTQDLTKDAFNDVIFSGPEEAFWDVQGANGQKQFVSFGNPAGFNQIGSGDYDGDGIDETLLSQGPGGVIGYYNVTDSGFQSWQALNQPHPAAPWIFLDTEGRSDFTGDGSDDLLFLNSGTGEVAFWDINAGGAVSFVSLGARPGWLPVVDPLGGTAINGITGNFNGDTTDDILLSNGGFGTVSPQLSVLETKAGSGLVADWELIDQPGPAGWRAVGAGHVFGDTSDDIVFQHGGAGTEVGVWNIVDSEFAGFSSLGTPGADWTANEVHDFNADGFDDVLLSSGGADVVGYWATQNGTFAGWQALGAVDPTVWTIV